MWKVERLGISWDDMMVELLACASVSKKLSDVVSEHTRELV